VQTYPDFVIIVLNLSQGFALICTMQNFLQIQPEVADALASGRAVVALESTIIAHGMPFPQNIEMAKKVEGIVRENGAVPATIACLGGKVCVGLSADQLHELATSQNVMKLSRRDMPYAISHKVAGATTVAATMIGAEMAGIKFFATGGIGGVHRGSELTGDISADLQELSRTSVAVISAGAKAILDIPKTLEYLETMGVPVIGFQSKYFGAFYSRSSGIELELDMHTPKDVAAFLNAKWTMGLDGGALISNPIPVEFEIPNSEIEPTILAAVLEAERNGIGGKKLTPFLLARIKEITEGRSLNANLELVYNNAKVAAMISSEYSRLISSEL
jgi:pseudouridine-5'-phosphate glycosidase